jgi:hypothetical protein
MTRLRPADKGFANCLATVMCARDALPGWGKSGG